MLGDDVDIHGRNFSNSTDTATIITLISQLLKSL